MGIVILAEIHTFPHENLSSLRQIWSGRWDYERAGRYRIYLLLNISTTILRFTMLKHQKKAPRLPRARSGPSNAIMLQDFATYIIAKIINDLHTIYTLGYTYSLLTTGIMVLVVLKLLPTVFNFSLSLERFFALLYALQFLLRPLRRCRCAKLWDRRSHHSDNLSQCRSYIFRNIRHRKLR